MPSPFPGMNPYLEHPDVFHDFHERFIPACAEALTPLVRPRYFVKLDEQVYVHELPGEARHLLGRPDVALTSRQGIAAGGATVTALGMPVYGQVPQITVEEERLSFLQVVDRQSRRVVTVIELLSPTNQSAGPDREQYIAKRHRLLSTPVHLVEIDLLRCAARMPVDGLPRCEYCVMVSTCNERPRVALWPVGLRDRLPVVPLPLDPPDPPAAIDLQQLLHRVYDAAGYEDYVYAVAPQPALTPEDAAWAQQLLAQTPRPGV